MMLSVLHTPGKTVVDAMTAVDGSLMKTDAFGKHHPDFQATAQTYQSALGRSPTICEVVNAEKIAADVRQAGGSGADAQQALVATMKDRPVDLNSEVFQQPDGSTCAPSSVMNAMLAFGLPGDFNKCLELTHETVGSGGGFGGNAQLLADQVNGANLGMTANQTFMDPAQQNPATLAEQLKRGTAAIVNGTTTGGASGHFLCVKGLDEKGNFVVSDSWAKEQNQITGENGGDAHWTAAQMDRFMHGGKNPPGFITLVRS
jgi:hypothetical protein